MDSHVAVEKIKCVIVMAGVSALLEQLKSVEYANVSFARVELSHNFNATMYMRTRFDCCQLMASRVCSVN